jgi:hypothetical protein
LIEHITHGGTSKDNNGCEMTYFGYGYGNDTPLWQYDFLPQLTNSLSLFDFCTAPASVPADTEPAPTDATTSGDATSDSNSATQ